MPIPKEWIHSKYIQYFLLLVFILVTPFYYKSAGGCLKDLATKIHRVDLKMMIRNLGTEGSGLEVLPRRARIALGLMKRFDVRNYKTSNTIKNEAELFQRIVEGSWPKKYDANAQYLILLRNDPILEPCKLLHVEDGVAIAFCN